MSRNAGILENKTRTRENSLGETFLFGLPLAFSPPMDPVAQILTPPPPPLSLSLLPPPPNPPEWSGKMFVLYRLMREMRKPGNGNDKIVIVSNYTQTLNLIGRMCRENTWGFCRLDGSITMKKRQKMVSERAMRV